MQLSSLIRTPNQRNYRSSYNRMMMISHKNTPGLLSRNRYIPLRNSITKSRSINNFLKTPQPNFFPFKSRSSIKLRQPFTPSTFKYKTPMTKLGNDQNRKNIKQFSLQKPDKKQLNDFNYGIELTQPKPRKEGKKKRKKYTFKNRI